MGYRRPGRPRGKGIVIDEAEFTKDWMSYMYLRLMADKYHMSTATVVRRASKLGLNPRFSTKNRKKKDD